MKSIISRIVDFLTPNPKPTQLEIMAESIREYNNRAAEFVAKVRELPDGEFKMKCLDLASLMFENVRQARIALDEEKKRLAQRKLIDEIESIIAREDAMRGGL